MSERMNIDLIDYHADWTRLSPSKIEKIVARWERGEPIWQPHIFKAYRDGLIPLKTSDAFDLGSLFDSTITEPHLVSQRFVKGPCEDRRLKEWKEATALVHPKTLIQPSVWDAAQLMHFSWLNNPHRPQGEPLYRQPTYYFERQNVPLKVRPDLEYEDRIVELKTTRHAVISDWERDAFSYGYHRQAAFQRWATGKPIWHFVVSTTPPYPCWAFRFTEDQLQLGERQMDQMLSKYRDCEEFNDWDAPGTKEVNVAIAPLWLLHDDMANEILP